MRGCVESGAGQSVASTVLSSAEPVVHLMLKTFTETLVEDKIKARVNCSVGMRPEIKCKDQRSWQAAEQWEVKGEQEVIDVCWKPTNSEESYYGDQHSYNFTLLPFYVLMVFVDVFTRCSSIPHMQHNFRIKTRHCQKRNHI